MAIGPHTRNRIVGRALGSIRLDNPDQPFHVMRGRGLLRSSNCTVTLTRRQWDALQEAAERLIESPDQE